MFFVKSPSSLNRLCQNHKNRRDVATSYRF